MFAKLALGRFHVWVWLVVVDREGFERRSSADLGRVACLDYYSLQFITMIRR